MKNKLLKNVLSKLRCSLLIHFRLFIQKKVNNYEILLKNLRFIYHKYVIIWQNIVSTCHWLSNAVGTEITLSKLCFFNAQCSSLLVSRKFPGWGIQENCFYSELFLNAPSRTALDKALRSVISCLNIQGSRRPQSCERNSK